MRWTSASRELQVAACVKAIHEPVDVEDQFQRKAQTWKSFYFAVRAFAFDEELVEPAAPEPGPAGSSAEVCNVQPAEPASSELGLAVSGSPGAQQVSEHGHAGLGRPSAEVCDAELAEPASSEPGLAVSGGPGAQQVSEHGRAGSGRSSAEACVEAAAASRGLPTSATTTACSKCPSTRKIDRQANERKKEKT